MKTVFCPMINSTPCIVSGDCDSRDAVLVQCVQRSVAVLGGGSLVHVPEALHGGDVPLDALLREVEL